MKKTRYKIGDFITIVKIPPGLKNDSEMKTKMVFELCLGKTYAIRGFDQFGHLEIDVGKDVDEIVGGYMNTIWIEPEFVIPARHGL